MGCPPCEYCNNWPGHIRWEDGIEGTKIIDFICSECIASEKKDPRIFIGFRERLAYWRQRAFQAESKVTKLEAEIKNKESSK